MPKWTSTSLGNADLSQGFNTGIGLMPDPRPGPITASLVDRSRTAYLGSLRSFPNSNTVEIRTHASSTGGNVDSAGPDLVDSWETSGRITVDAGSLSKTFDIANATNDDTAEPYKFRFPDSEGVAAWVTSFRALPSADRNSATVTLATSPFTSAPTFADSTGDAQEWQAGSTIPNLTVPAATGEPSPTYAVVGSLPAGLTFNASTRLLSGVPQRGMTGTITIRATNSAGTADWTVGYVTAAPPTPVVPSRPIAPTLTVRANGDIYAVATRPFDGNSALTGFDWRIRAVGTSAWTNHRFLAVDILFRGLRRDQDHEVQVRAVNQIGRGAYSPSATARRAPMLRHVRASGSLQSLRGAARISMPLGLSEFDGSRLSPPLVLGLITTGAQSSGTVYRQQSGQPRIGSLAAGSDLVLRPNQDVTRVAVFSNGAALRLWDNPSGQHLSTLFTAGAGYNVFIQTSGGLVKLTRGSQGGNFSNWHTTVGSEQAILRSLLTTGTRFILAIATPSPVKFVKAAATLPTLAASAKASRLVPVVRGVRAAATLPAVTGSARATRAVPAARTLRAAATLPVVKGSARASRTEATSRKVRATGRGPTLSGQARVKRLTASARRLKASGVLPALAGAARATFVRSPIRKVRAAGILPSLTGTARISGPIAGLHLADFNDAGLSPPIVLGLITTGVQVGGTFYRAPAHPAPTLGLLAAGSDMLLQGTQSITRGAIYSNGGELRLWDNPSPDDFTSIFPSATRYKVFIQTSAGLAALNRGPQGGNFSRWTTSDSDAQAILRSLLITGTQFIIAVAQQTVNQSVRAAATLPSLAGQAKASRTSSLPRKARASATLPGLAGSAKATRVSAAARKVRASVILPTISGSVKGARVSAASSKVRATGSLPSLRGAARISRALPIQRRLRAVGVLPRIDGTASASYQARIATAPDRPDAPRLAAISRITIVETHIAPADNGAVITFYDLRYRVVGAPAWVIISDVSTLVNQITSLMVGTTYEVQVRAKNSAGNSPWSPSGTAGTKAAPSGITKQAVPRYKLLIDFFNVGSFDISKFVDIWEDVQQANCFTGREMQGQGRRGPIVGQLNATLNNIEGKYIKQNFASPYYDRILPGIRAVLQMNLPQNPLDYVDIWCGFLDDVSVDIKLEPSLAQLKAFGALGVISTEEIGSHIYGATATADNDPVRINVDKLVLDAFAAAGWPVAERLIGSTSAAVKFPSFRGETPRNEIADLELHELGRLWESKNSIEVLRFTGEAYRYTGDNRKVRMTYRNNEARKDRLRDVVYTALPTPFAQTDKERAYVIYTTGEPREPAKDVYNVISGTYGDRNFDFSAAGRVICYQSNNEYKVEPKSTFILNQAATIAPPIFWDASLTSGADNGGYKVSTSLGGAHDSSLTVGVSVSSQSDKLYVTVKNQTNSSIFIRDISVYGRQLVRSENTISVRDNTSILRYQTKPLPLDLRYVETETQCRDLIETLLSTYAEPRLTYDVKYDAWADHTAWYNASHVEHSQRVDFAAVGQNLADTCFIEKVSHSINPRTSHVVDLTLSASDQDTNSSLDGVIILDLGPNLGVGVIGR